MPDQVYQPPYDSPIEDIFAWHCQKYLQQGVGLDSQVEFKTHHGVFRVDFVLVTENTNRVGVECDGRDFHEPFRDEFRDAILLGEGHLGTLYHFRGCDITYYPEDCIWLMSTLDPDLFSERGRPQLSYLHRLEIVSVLSSPESYVLRSLPGEPKYRFWAFRRSVDVKSHANPTGWPHWRVLYRFACEHPLASLDELIKLNFANLSRNSKIREF